VKLLARIVNLLILPAPRCGTVFTAALYASGEPIAVPCHRPAGHAGGHRW